MPAFPMEWQEEAQGLEGQPGARHRGTEGVESMVRASVQDCPHCLGLLGPREMPQKGLKLRDTTTLPEWTTALDRGRGLRTQLPSSSISHTQPAPERRSRAP